MEHIERLLLMLSKLNYLQAIFLLCAVFIFFVGPHWIKNKYLKRTNQKYDKVIEDRNSWILIPPPYNVIEKIQIVIIYISSFVLIILSVNMKG